MKNLLRLQALDLEIEAHNAREAEIPKQKGKLEIYRKRLLAELEEREEARKALTLEQRERESEVEQRQAQIAKYDQQLFSVKKNEEYQALLHEIELLKKQIGVKEERIIAIMMALDEANARVAEDRARIDAELQGIDRQCAEIHQELERGIEERKRLQQQRSPIAEQVDRELMARYERIRDSKKTGPVVVPLRREFCSGCHMLVPAQITNEILAGEKIHSCAHCGRLLYHVANFPGESDDTQEEMT